MTSSSPCTVALIAAATGLIVPAAVGAPMPAPAPRKTPDTNESRPPRAEAVPAPKIGGASAKAATPLIAAIQANDARKVAALLPKVPDVNVADANGSTPLMQAAAAATGPVVALLLGRGANVNAKDNDGFTPLMIAAYSGHADSAVLLLDKGADVNAADSQGHTALMGAAYSGRAEVVKLLLERGANVQTRDRDDFTALMVAAGAGNPESVRLLLDKGADVNAATKSGFTPVMQASGGRRPEVVKLLLDRGANVRAKAARGATALLVAAYAGNAPVVGQLLERGAEVNAFDTFGRTPLLGAAFSGSTPAATLLLDKGADLEFKTRSGLNPLMQAAYSGRLDAVKLFLERGANVDAATTHGLTPLMQAAGTGNVAICRLLLQNGADVNAHDRIKQTALKWALKRDQGEVAELLKRADPGTGLARPGPTGILPRASIAYAPDPPRPAIHGPRVVGASPRRPFLFRIPATGKAPLTFSAAPLPPGLKLDPKTGIVSGRIQTAGDYKVTLAVSGPAGKTTRGFSIVCGDKKLALTPPMGWNAWNVFGENVTADKVRRQADWLIKSGLAARGFNYIIVDDTWQSRRDDDGSIGANRRFGDMKALADYLHSKGLKLGVLSAASAETPSGFAGSAGYEEKDAALYAQWGVDYLKYDWGQPGSTKKEVTAEVLKSAYGRMRAALDKVDRDIVYTLTPYGFGNASDWAAEVGANSWWTSAQILDTWDSVQSNGFRLAGLAHRAGPGRWNDPGWLMIGRIYAGDVPRFVRLTPDEQQAEMSLWSMAAAPLILSCDLSQLDPSTLYPFTTALLTNDEVLDINQDPLGKPATRVAGRDNLEIWARPLWDGTKAVGVFNRGGSRREAVVSWQELGLTGAQLVRDVWLRKELSARTDGVSVTVPAHGVVLLKIGASRAPTAP